MDEQSLGDDDASRIGAEEVQSLNSARPINTPVKKSLREKFKEELEKDVIYEDIQEALLGTTIIEVPRVSREVRTFY